MKYTIELSKEEADKAIMDLVIKAGMPVPDGASTEVIYSRGTFNVTVDTAPEAKAEPVKRTAPTITGNAAGKPLPGKAIDPALFKEETPAVEKKAPVRTPPKVTPVAKKVEEAPVEEKATVKDVTPVDDVFADTPVIQGDSDELEDDTLFEEEAVEEPVVEEAPAVVEEEEDLEDIFK